MSFKNVFLIANVTLYAFAGTLHAVGPANQEVGAAATTSDTSDQQNATQIVVDGMIEAAKIRAEAQREAARIQADTYEKLGLETYKKWEPILIAAIAVYALSAIRQIFNR